MVRSKLPSWVGRVLIVVVVVAAVAGSIAVWFEANRIRSDLLVPAAHDGGEPMQIAAIGGGRVVLPRSSETERDGVWGLRSTTAYGQVGDVIRVDEAEVERTLRTLTGSFDVGDLVTLDVDAFPEDPEVAHGIGFEAPRVPGELGPQPAWVIEGRRASWIVFAHGEGTDRQTQALRMIPTLVEQGFPIMVVTYRNDVGAPPSPDGLRRWGLDEWRDIDAALVAAQRQGAEGFIMYGHDLGAEVISMFLHESEYAGMVQAVVLDSPVFDLERLVDDHSAAPAAIAQIGQQLAAVRFGVEWRYLDQISRADEFDVPFLLLHGVDDGVVPFSSSEEFAALRPDIAELARFEQGGHGDLWNIDPLRYEAVVTDFLTRVAGAE
jgi:uncharacterized protein